MKDETAGKPITEFIGLRSKMYSYKLTDGTGDKKAKGVKKCVVKNNITHSDYKKVLDQKLSQRHKMKTIRSQNHQIGSYEINKKSLSCFDDKRYISPNGISSLAYGHKDIKK